MGNYGSDYRKRSSYYEFVAVIEGGQQGMSYPDRKALKIWVSPVYGQLKDSLRIFTTAQDAYTQYQHLKGDGAAPLGHFVPPRPPFNPLPGGNPLPPDDDSDDLMGQPDPSPPSYGDLPEPAPNAMDQVLLNVGLNPPTPTP